MTWEYKCLNLKKIPGMTLENKLNEWGADGWELVCVVDGYATLKRAKV